MNSPDRTRRLRLAGFLAVFSVLASLLGGASAGPAMAADLSQFSPGNIVSDAVFYDSGTMSEGQISSFLQQKVPNCQSGYTCLKDFRQTTDTRAGDAYCSTYQGGANESSARIIAKVAQACGINPQVLLVTLQKEQGLVTHTWPSEFRYTSAMGQGCPDTAGCDARYYGFFNQMLGAARQFQVYAKSGYFTYYAPGKTWNVLYNPNRSCGSSPVYIENQATSNLYYYTPYQPNAASLRAGYGEGDGCSTYGNRNFFQYFSDWFGSPTLNVSGVIGDVWRASGGASGPFGQPTSSVWAWPNGAGWSQYFERADLFARAGGDTWAIKDPVRGEYRLVGEVASGLGWPRGDAVGVAGGQYQDFDGGRIYVRPDGRAFAVAAPIFAVHEAVGNLFQGYGWPTDRAARWLAGSRQIFDGGTIYQGPSATVPLKADAAAAFEKYGPSGIGWPSSAEQSIAGASVIAFDSGFLQRASSGFLTARGSLGGYYVRAGGPAGALGVIVADEVSDSQGYSQRFANGTVYLSSAGMFAVTDLRGALNSHGGIAQLGYPTGAQQTSGSSRSQQFANGTLTTGPSGPQIVRGAINIRYSQLGGASSALGAAKSAERQIAGGWVQDFEGGRIYCNAAGIWAVSNPVAAKWDAGGGVTGRLGWPTGPEVTSDGTIQQSFDGGLVVLAEATPTTGSTIVGTTLSIFQRSGGVAALGAPLGAETKDAVGWTQKFQKGTTFVPLTLPASVALDPIRAGFDSRGGTSFAGVPTAPRQVVGSTASQRFEQATFVETPSGVWATRGYIRTFYESRGGTSSSLGLPRTDETAIAGGFRQLFDRGGIYVWAGGAFTVEGSLATEYANRGGASGSLGWPTAGQTIVGGQVQQQFQNGTLVTTPTGGVELR